MVKTIHLNQEHGQTIQLQTDNLILSCIMVNHKKIDLSRLEYSRSISSTTCTCQFSMKYYISFRRMI